MVDNITVNVNSQSMFLKGSNRCKVPIIAAYDDCNCNIHLPFEGNAHISQRILSLHFCHYVCSFAIRLDVLSL
jgi:hypothetical protein